MNERVYASGCALVTAGALSLDILKDGTSFALGLLLEIWFNDHVLGR